MIFVAGSANLDFVVRATHIPMPGETVLGESYATYPGGKGANQAVACARSGGMETHFLCALGDDDPALLLQRALIDAGVQLQVQRPAGAATGVAFVCVDGNGQNAITVAPGANACLLPEHLPPMRGFTHLLVQLEIPLATVIAYALAARAQGMQVVLNAAPAQVLPASLLAAVDVLIVNEDELGAVGQHAGTVEACLEHIPVPLVIVTLGAAGCCARTPQGLVHQQAFAVKAIDTTGAGDTFCGTLVAELARHADVAQALRTASAAAAIACTRMGAQAGIPSRDQVRIFLEKQA